MQALLDAPRKHRAQAETARAALTKLSLENAGVFVSNFEVARATTEAGHKLATTTGSLQQALPQFEAEAAAFAEQAAAISARHRRNRQTLQHHLQLVELLELPQLMDACVRARRFDSALDLVAHANALERRHVQLDELGGGKGALSVVRGVVAEVRAQAAVLREHLLERLRGPAQLPACLSVVNSLRRLALLTHPGPPATVERQLQRAFLDCRSAWLERELADAGAAGSAADAPLRRWLERQRSHSFTIVSQYRAVFADDREACEDTLLNRWVVAHVERLCQTLGERVAEVEDGAAIAALADESMHLGASLARVGADFRGLLVPLFAGHVRSLMTRQWREAAAALAAGLADGVPPPALAAELTNAVLASLNQLRHCAYESLGPALAAALQEEVIDEGARLLGPGFAAPLADLCAAFHTIYGDAYGPAPPSGTPPPALPQAAADVEAVRAAYARARELRGDARRLESERAAIQALLPVAERCVARAGAADAAVDWEALVAGVARLSPESQELIRLAPEAGAADANVVNHCLSARERCARLANARRTELDDALASVRDRAAALLAAGNAANPLPLPAEAEAWLRQAHNFASGGGGGELPSL